MIGIGKNDRQKKSAIFYFFKLSANIFKFLAIKCFKKCIAGIILSFGVVVGHVFLYLVPFYDFEINNIGPRKEAKHAGRHLGL